VRRINDSTLKMIVILGYSLMYIVPVLLGFLLFHANLSFGSPGDWLGFWGGYLGAIVAIGGVYWQVNRTIKNDREQMFSQSRPFFILKMEDTCSKEISYYFYNYDVDGVSLGIKQVIGDGQTIPCFVINNVSQKNMMAVKVVLEHSGEDNTCVYIDKILAGSKVKLLPKAISDSLIGCMSLDKVTSDVISKGDKIRIYFTTEVREKVKLEFEVADNFRITYNRDDRLIENHGQRISKEEYNSSGFIESSSFKDEIAGE